MVKVSVKWGKELYTDVDVDTSQPPIAFKTQLFSLSGVPPDRQKVLIKGAQLKDDEWGKAQPKDGMTLMMMGTADPVAVEAPKNAPTFLEDLPEAEQEAAENRGYGTGLANLGNTCYMNSTVQCLYSVEGLREAIQQHRAGSGDPQTARLVTATRELFTDLEKGGAAFPPYGFLMALRQRFPQFSQQTNEGIYMQQDAEECFTQVMYALKEQLKGEDGKSIVDKLFGVQTVATLKCEETGEERKEVHEALMLKCNISAEVNHLHEGLRLALVDDKEAASEQLGRLALFKGSAQLCQLPPYLNVQLVRFFYNRASSQKAKILRKVGIPLELDLYDLCTPQLREELEGPRKALKDWEDAEIERKKRAPKQQKLDTGAAAPAAADTPAAASGSAAPAAAAEGGDVDMQEAGEAAAAGDGAGGASSSSGHAGALTGKYTLTGVLTHKGRSADSGHYVAWIKQKDGSWICYDDDKLVPRTSEDVQALSGGGDWHMAYLLLYQAVKVPASA